VKRKKWSMILAVVLALLLIVPLLINACQSFAVTRSDVNELEDQADELAEQRNEIEDKIQELDAQSDSMLETKAALDERIEITSQQIDTANELLAAFDGQIEQKKAELAQAEAAEQAELELYLKRVRAMEESGTVSYIGILFQADSFSDLLSRAEIIEEIIEYDQGVMENLAYQHKLVEEAKASLEEDRQKQQQVKDGLEKTKAELDQQRAEAQAMINQIEANTAELESAYAEVEAEEARVQQQISDMLAELARQNSQSGTYVGGEYTWPLPGHYNITSHFGMRMHPTLKVYKMHTGIDISAPKGTEIVAANAGTVIKAAYSSAYGNYVVINHGGGQATLYAHMSKILVSADQYVDKGETIGKVGSTGYSTGNHLHFEIIINGEQKNPEDYFTKQ